jgi:acetolactate synthase-1/3 small subunit
MRHTLSVLVENEFGVLARIAGMFSARGFNIESLTVAETLDPTVSRMTIITRGSDQIIEQITKQLHRLVNVLKVVDVTEEGNHITREMVLVKVNADGNARAEVLRLVQIFRARVVDVSPRALTVEATGSEDKIKALIELLQPLGIKEIARSGLVAMARGAKTLNGERRAASRGNGGRADG